MITMVVRAAGLPDPPVDFQPPFPNFSAVHYPYARRAASAGLLDTLIGMGPDYDFTAPGEPGRSMRASGGSPPLNPGYSVPRQAAAICLLRRPIATASV